MIHTPPWRSQMHLGFNFVPIWHLKKQCLYFLYIVQTDGFTSSSWLFLACLVRNPLQTPAEAYGLLDSMATVAPPAYSATLQIWNQDVSWGMRV